MSAPYRSSEGASATTSGDRPIQCSLWQFLDQVVVVYLLTATSDTFAHVLASLSNVCDRVTEAELEAYVRARALDAGLREELLRWRVAHDNLCAAREARANGRLS